MTEHQQAREWRRARGLDVPKLAELAGYAPEVIYLMERGVNSKNEPVSDFVWQRYKMICAGIDAQLRSGTVFDWGK